MSQKRLTKIRNFMIKKGVLQRLDIMEEFGYKKHNVVNYIKQLDALSSVNSKGQFYILPDQYVFRDDDLLYLGEIVFYKGGTLLNAICHLVEKSESGLGARELDKVLKTSTHSQLTKLFRTGRISRIPAINRQGKAFIYFSSNTEKAELQHNLYHKPMSSNDSENKNILPEELPDVIDILLTVVKHPDFSVKSISLSLKRRGKDISSELITRVFDKYRLGKKNY